MKTNIIPLDRTSKTKDLEAAEEKAIKYAMSKGHKDPREDEHHKKMLYLSDGNKTYRRFITDFLSVTQDDIGEKQIRAKVSDEKYCKEELAPLINKEGLHHPILVGVGTGSRRPTEGGHHRAYSTLQVLAWDSCPAFEVDSALYEILPDGTYGKSATDSFTEALARIQSNPPRTHLNYKSTDVCIQLAELRKADKTFNGLVPSGEFPNREQLDAIMDVVHPRQFRPKSTRTKIYNQWKRRGADANSKVKTVTFADKTNELVKAGLDPGVTTGRKGQPKRKGFLEHYDEKERALIGMTNTNGRNFEANIISALIEAQHDGTLDGDEFQKLIVFSEVYTPKETLTSLNQERNNFIQKARKWKKILNDCGVKISLTKVIFPKQLTVASDNGKVVEL